MAEAKLVLWLSYVIGCRCTFYVECRHDSKEILDLLFLQDDSDWTLSSDSEKEADLKHLYLELSFPPKRDLGSRFNYKECSELEFERLFR